MAELEFIFR